LHGFLPRFSALPSLSPAGAPAHACLSMEHRRGVPPVWQAMCRAFSGEWIVPQETRGLCRLSLALSEEVAQAVIRFG
jgi:hypothetical protein